MDLALARPTLSVVLGSRLGGSGAGERPLSNTTKPVNYQTSIFFLMFVPCISNIKTLLLKSNQCTLLVVSILNKIKVTINTPTCFGSRRNQTP